MNFSDEHQVCLLVNELGPEQLDRYLYGEEAGLIICEHIAFCAAVSCRNAFAGSEKRTQKRISDEEKHLSRDQCWRRDLLNREIIYVMRERGVIK